MTTLNRMIWLLPSVVLVMAATICSSQVSAGPQRESKPQTASGQVVNSITGEPIARARVQVGAQQAALTDHDGHFEFDNVSDEAAYAFASKPGYFAEDKAVPAQGQSITLQLIPEAIVFGTITDQNGQPIQDLHVQLTMLRVENGSGVGDRCRQPLPTWRGSFALPNSRRANTRLPPASTLKACWRHLPRLRSCPLPSRR